MTSKEELETLKQKIIESFADVSHPQENIAPHECEECREVRTTFAKLNWRTIKPDILEENFSIIPLFSSEAFHYFLPAYLIYSLEHFFEHSNTVNEYTIYALTPNNKAMNETTMREYWQDKFRNFTDQQMRFMIF